MPGDSKSPSTDPTMIAKVNPGPAIVDRMNQASTAIPARSRAEWIRFRVL